MNLRGYAHVFSGATLNTLGMNPLDNLNFFSYINSKYFYPQKRECTSERVEVELDTICCTNEMGNVFSGLFTGPDPSPRVESGSFRNLTGRVGSGRVGSGQEVFKL